MSHNFRDRDNSRSRSRERERRGVPHKFSPRESHRNVIKLHVGNLPLSTSEDDVLRYFQRFGRVDDVKIMRKNASGQPLRESLYGFIVMSNEEEARRALEMINHNAELGWHVSYSKEKGRFDDSRRSPDRSHRPRDQRDQYRKDSDEDNRYRQYDRNRRERSPRREYDNRRRDGSYSPDRRPQERGPAQGAALMNLLNNNMNTGNPNMAADLMKILQLPPDQLSQLTNTMEKNILNGNTILVRELWIGNLPENLQDKKLSNTVEMFGEVENIEFYNKPNTSFAFVKFKRVSQASKAYEGAQSLKLLLDSPNLRVTFSDHQRRRNVVGDSIDYENDEDLTSIIYIGFNSGAFIAPEGAIREMFSKYGEVLNIMVNQSPKDNSAKSYVLVEMGNLNQAKAARQRLFIEDDTREKRTRLGDRNCELAILVKAKNSAHSSHQGQMQNQQGGHQGQQFPPQQGMGRNPMYNQQQGGQHYQQGQQQRPYQQGGYQNQPYQQRQQYQQYPNQQHQYQQHQGQGQGQYQQQQRHDQPYGLGQQRQQGHYQNPRDQQYQQQSYQGGQYQQQQQQQQPPSGPYQQGSQQYQGQRNPPYGQQQQQPNAPYGGGYQSQPPGMGDQRPYNPMGNQAPPPNAPGPMSGYGQGAQAPQQGMGQIGTGTSPVAQPGRFGSSPVQYPPNIPPQQGGFDPNQQQNRPPVGMGTSPVAVRSMFSPTGDMSKGQGVGEKKEDGKKAGHMQLLDTLQTIFAQTQGEKPQTGAPVEQKKPEEEKKVVEEEHDDDDGNQDIFWSGFITKNKQNRVGVDAYMIEGDENILKEYFNLNISHRTLFEEIEKRAKKAIVIFRPAGETHLSLFNDYLKYFAEKQRAGVVTLKKNTLYILPPCEETFKIHKFGQNELLGIFSDLSDIPKGEP